MTNIAHAANDGLIRWSRIKSEMNKGGSCKLAEEIAAILDKTDLVCEEHGDIEDPILGMEGASGALIAACPYCVHPDLRALWEAQGND